VNGGRESRAVSPTTPSPVPYRISPSRRVVAQLNALSKQAAVAGLGATFLDALKRMYHVLRIYPQFGEPLRDFKALGATQYAATFPPLYVEHIIDEPNRTVFIGMPIKALANAGFQE
jgi:hypothetical protein